MREKKKFQLASIAAMLKHFTFIYMWKGEEAEMRCEFPCHLHFGLSFSHTNTHKHRQALLARAPSVARALSLSLSSFTSKVSPPRCCATRTIIIKTKMFKIHFLCFFTHRRISAVLVCHLSCASSLSTSFTHTHTHKYLCKRQRAKQLSRLLMQGAQRAQHSGAKTNNLVGHIYELIIFKITKTNL